MKRMRIWVMGALVMLPALAPGMTADELIQQTGIAGGFYSFPRFRQADQPLALELARRTNFVVHLMSPDDRVLTAARQAAEKEGLLGRSLYVEKGSFAALPYADRLVDLLVVSDLSDADLTPELRAEWLRVLGPRRGTALVGRAKDAGKGLSAKTLKAWIADVPLAREASGDSGVWALVRASLPAGSDAWTHRCHDPGNAQVSLESGAEPIARSSYTPIGRPASRAAAAVAPS